MSVPQSQTSPTWNSHEENINLHKSVLTVPSENKWQAPVLVEEKLVERCSDYFIWAGNALETARDLQRSLADRAPGLPQLECQRLFIRIHWILFTHYSVLCWVDSIVWPTIVEASIPSLVTEDRLHELRDGMVNTGRDLLPHCPKGPNNEDLGEQWATKSFQTKILPETIFELCLQVLCSSTRTGRMFTLAEIPVAVGNCFGHLVNTNDPIGVPKVFFIGLNQDKVLVVAATQGSFSSARSFPPTLRQRLQNHRMRTMENMPAQGHKTRLELLVDECRQNQLEYQQGIERRKEEALAVASNRISLHGGEAYEFDGKSFKNKPPCNKCRGIYETSFPLTGGNKLDNPLYQCTEDAWVLQVWEKVFVLPYLLSEPKFQPRESHKAAIHKRRLQQSTRR